MAHEGCRLTIEDIKIKGLIHSPEEEKIVQGILTAQFICPRCNIDREVSLPFVRLIHDLRFLRDPLLPSKLKEIEEESPGPELEAKKNEILLEYCPLQSGLRNSLPVLD